MQTALWITDQKRKAIERQLQTTGVLARPRRPAPPRIAVSARVRKEDFGAIPTWIERRKGDEPVVATFHPAQIEAWLATDQIIAIQAGWQSGKTIFLAYWLRREIQLCGAGDYGAFSSTFPILSKKFLPELKKAFRCNGPISERLAEFHSGTMQLVLTSIGELAMWGETQETETIIQLGYAIRSESLESATLKGVVWDEVGMKSVPVASFMTVRARVMVNRGRLCMASVPYVLNWFFRLCTGLMGVACKVISFASWVNPFNPPETDPYWIEMRASMQEWEFLMKYAGLFTRASGLIYTAFDEARHVIEPFDIGEAKLMVMPFADFGGVNVAFLLAAYDSVSKILYIIGEYHPGVTQTYDQQKRALEKLLHRWLPFGSFAPGCGGNKHGEDGWREAYREKGIPLNEPPINDVRLGIKAVFTALAENRLFFFRGHTDRVTAQFGFYAWETDEEGNVEAEIADKAKYHLLDCLRAGCVYVFPPRTQSSLGVANRHKIEVPTDADVL